jgi:hypothetical protein
MDPYDGVVLGKSFDPKWEAIRKSLGYTRTLARRVSLKRMLPSGNLVSSKYCLANSGREYLLYAPQGLAVTVNLNAATGTLAVEWVDTDNGTFQDAPPIQGGSIKTFTSPLDSAAVLYLKKIR